MGMISGEVTGDRNGVTFPNNLLFRVEGHYSSWVKLGVNADRSINIGYVPTGRKHIFIRNQQLSKWELVDSPHPFNCLSTPQNIEVQI